MRATSMRELIPGLWVIPDGLFFLYVIDGPQPMLVDTGVSGRAQDVVARLETLLGTRPLDAILLTHSHYDHVGGMSALEARFGCRVIAGSRTCEVLQSTKALGFINHLNQEFDLQVGGKTGMPVTTPQRMEAVRAGMVLELESGQKLRILETPGHTRCSITFVLEPQGVAFVGDAAGVVGLTGTNKPLFLSSYSQYETSLQHLAQESFEMLALPHNSVVRGAKACRRALAAALEQTHHVRERIQALAGQTPDAGQLAVRLLEEEFPSVRGMGPREALLVNLEAMVKAVMRDCMGMA